MTQALVRMGLSDVSEITESKQVAAFLILSRYYALSRFSELLGYRSDTEGLVVEGDRQTVFDNVVKLISRAAMEAAAYGYVMEAGTVSLIGSANEEVDQEAATSWGRGVLDTGYLRPLSAEEQVPYDYSI